MPPLKKGKFSVKDQEWKPSASVIELILSFLATPLITVNQELDALKMIN